MSGNPIRKVSLRNLAAHKVRLVLTVLSVVLGTAFVTGSFVFTDTLQRTFDDIVKTDPNVAVQVSAEGETVAGVPVGDVEVIRGVPGVDNVVPKVGGQLVLLDKDGAAIQSGGAPMEGFPYIPPDRAVAEVPTFTSGAAPAADDEIAINSSAAERADLAVGDKTKVLTQGAGMQPVTVSGIYESTDGADTGGYVGVMFTEARATQLFSDGRTVQQIVVSAQDGVSDTDLRDRIASTLPDAKVQTGAEVAEETRSFIADVMKYMNYFLLAFGAIALLVGTFIIYNTFSMIVAQRVRELALLRAIGASRGQVGWSVVLEAIVVGVIGSIIGILGGIGLAYLLRALLNAAGSGLPSGSLALLPRTIVLALVIGIVVTVVSAYAPARRAMKVAPVAAMREDDASNPETLRIRSIVGSLMLVAGVVLVVVAGQGTGGSAAGLVGVGALLAVFGVLLALPLLSRPLVSALSAVFARPFGAVGRLARTNATRNPRRTAATAFALTLGLMMVSIIAVIGSSAKASMDEMVDQGIRADLILAGPQAIGVPVAAVDAVSDLPDVRSTVGVGSFPVTVVDGDRTEYWSSLTGRASDALDIDMAQGTDDLGPDGLMVSETTAREEGLSVGSTIDIASPLGDPATVRVEGVFVDNQILGNQIVSNDVYQRFVPENRRTSWLVFLSLAPGADVDRTQAAVQDAMKPFVVVQVLDRDEFKGQQAQQIDMLLAILYGLLALAVVIAILGIVNTLALSVVERRREIGMLRAVGMQRAQVRRAIYLESFLIAVFGAVIGLALGLLFGWAFVHTLREEGISVIAVPWGQVIGMLIGSGIVGVVAAVWPGIRAARTPPLDAIAD